MPPVFRHLPIWLGFGSLSGLTVITVAMITNPVVAIALPFGLFACLLLIAQPFLGVLALVVFSHLDAVEKLLFGFLPLSAFKLIGASTFVIMVIKGAQLRGQIWILFREPIAVCAGLVITMAFVSSVFAEDRGAALGALKSLLSLQLLTILIIVFANTRQRITVLIYAIAATSLVSAFLLIADIGLGLSLVGQSEAATTARTAEGFDRSSGGSDYNPTTAASMLLTGVIFALVHVLETGKWRVIMAGIVVVGTLAVVLSFARSAVVAYALVGMMLFWRNRRERFAPFVIVCAILLLLLSIPFIPAEYWARMGSIVGVGSGADWTLGRRLTYNVIGLDLMTKYPLLGVGPGNFPHHFSDPAYRFMPGRTMLGRELHNMYLSIIVQLGLGSVPFFGMLGYSLSRIKAVIRAPSDPQFYVMALALGYGFAAYLIASLFLPNEYTKYTWLLCALCAALYHNNCRAKDET